MKDRDYIPRKDAELVAWADNLIREAVARYTSYDIPPPDSEMKDSFLYFTSAIERCSLPNKGKVDTFVKNEARKRLVKSCRKYVQAYLAKNPKVSDEERIIMGLHVYDTIPTPIGAPVGMVTATAFFPNPDAIGLKIQHMDETPVDERANYGVKIAYDIFNQSDPEPIDPSMLTKSIFTRRKKEVIPFEGQHRGKLVRFSLRYENSKGDVGQWCPYVSAIIP